MSKQQVIAILAVGSALTVFLCVAVLLRFWTYRADPALSRDGYLYLKQTEDLLQGKVTKNGQPQFYQWVTAQTIRLTGWKTAKAAVVVNIAAGSLCVIPIWLLARYLFASWIPAFLAAAGMTFYPKLVRLSVEAQRECCYLFFFCWMLYWLFAIRKKNSWLTAAAGGLLLALGTHCRWEMLEFIPVLIAVWFWQIWKKQRPWQAVVQQTLIFSFSFLLVLGGTAWLISPDYLMMFSRNLAGRFSL